MMKAGTQTGSLMNHLFSRAVQPAPQVGMGATILMWTDRKAGTIVKVTKTQVHVQEDTATRIDKNGMSESQEYSFKPNPNGSVHVFRLHKDGSYHDGSHHLVVGGRSHYYDYSF